MIKELACLGEPANGEWKTMYPNRISRMQECARLKYKVPKDLKEAKTNQYLSKQMEGYKNGNISVDVSVVRPTESELC